MGNKVLGDYNIARQVSDEINYHSGDCRYMVLRTEPGWDVYGQGTDAVTFTCIFGKALSDAAWAGTYGKGALVVDLANVLRLPWEELPVVHDNENED